MQRALVLMFITGTIFAGLTMSGQAADAGEHTSIGQAIVGFWPDEMPDLGAGERFGGHVVLRVDHTGAFAVVQADDLVPLREALVGDPRVAYVEDDALVTVDAVPDDPRWSSQYGPPLMGFQAAWDYTFGISSVVVAVLDTGIQRSHPDFDPSLLLQGRDYVNDDDDPNDDCGHGTHVAGTVGAWTNNGVGVAGMAQAKILPMKVLGPGLLQCQGSSSDIASAIHDATDQGAHIISMSLGGGGSTSMRSAADRAWDQGVLVIASAGNDGGCCVSPPASYDSVIAVAAVGPSKTRASYSSTGAQVEIAAPGSDIVSTYNNGGYASLSGTSMAAPHVAGAAALAFSWDPTITNQGLRDLMAATAEDLGTPGRDTSYGHGLMRIDAIMASLVPPLPGPENRVPMAAFSWSPDGLDVLFDAGASDDPDGDALTYSWSFGDGSTATGTTAQYTFPANGTYTVALDVADGRGGTSRLAWDVPVSGQSWGDPAPDIARLTDGAWTDTSITADDERYFKFLLDEPVDLLTFETRGPGCRINGLLCDLDMELAARHAALPTDSAADCRADPRGSTASCFEVEPELGWWFVRLKATEGGGDVDLRATATGGADAFAAGNAPPLLRWGYDADDLAVTFSAEHSADPDADPLTFQWTTDFGDFTGVSFAHTFSAAGVYDVLVIAEDDVGGVAHLAGVVQVGASPNEPPVADFSALPEERLLHLDASLSSDPEGEALNHTWDFGDGTTGFGQAVSHAYATDGTYVVRLTVTDSKGATDTIEQTLDVAKTPDPAPGIEALQKGTDRSLTVESGTTHPFKVYLDPGTDWINFGLDGAACNLFGCPHDVDLVVKYGAPVAGGAGDCIQDTDDANANCFSSEATGGWWFVELRGESGSGTVSVRADWP